MYRAASVWGGGWVGGNGKCAPWPTFLRMRAVITTFNVRWQNSKTRECLPPRELNAQCTVSIFSPSPLQCCRSRRSVRAACFLAAVTSRFASVRSTRDVLYSRWNIVFLHLLIFYQIFLYTLVVHIVPWECRLKN